MPMSWRLPEDITEARRAALEAAGQAMLDEASSRAPVLSGELVESGFVESDGVTVRVGFDAPYAVKQHYRTDFEHPGGGGAMFLYDAAGDFGPEFERIAAAEVARRLGS